jgi:hypothetical protein
MGNPVVVFTTYGNSSFYETTNVSGHSANSTQSPFVELKSDAVPQSALFSNGTFSVTDFDTVRIVTTENTINSEGGSTATHENTVYETRGRLGTFALSGGQFELCEFDTGAKGSSVADHFSKSGVSHNYVAFANTGDGNGLLRNADGSVIGSATAVVGPPTVNAPDAPFANIEYDVAHTSTPLQAIAGGGTTTKEGTNMDGVYVGTITPNVDDDDVVGTFVITNFGARTDSALRRSFLVFAVDSDGAGQSVEVVKTSNLIMEDWYPQQEFSQSTSSADVHKGTIQFQVHPDSEYVMAENMTSTNVAVASVAIAPSGDVGPVATHSKVTVTTSAVHGLTDDQNQIVLTGATSPTHINGIHNVHSVSNTTVFTYEITKSTVSGGGSCSGTFKLQTYDGIDKTGAVIKTSADASATGIAEVVHGGCAGNNIVLLRGDTSSNISVGTQYYVHSTNATSTPIAPVKFTEGPTYKSMFREMGLQLDRDTGQISSNGAFAGGTTTSVITTGGFITLEETVTGKSFGTEFIVHEDGFGGKIETEDFNRNVTFPDSGLNELDSYFYKFKHARDYALNRVKDDGTITQSGDVVTLQGSTNLPTVARYKTLQYQNGFTTNVTFASSNTEFVVQTNSEITLGESYNLSYADTSWPVTNSSSYWFLDNSENSPVVDEDSNILIFKTTSESTNFKVHFTIKAQKVHSQMDVYTGDAGTTTAASVLNTIDGWGDFELGTGNYKDGFFCVSVYNNTDSDRDDQVIVFSDQNNASSNTLNFNGNAFKHRDDPDDATTEVAILNEESLANAYSNGDFTILTSV